MKNIPEFNEVDFLTRCYGLSEKAANEVIKNEDKRRISDLELTYKEVMEASNLLSCRLQALSLIASKIYGADLNAEICNGEEIEFRKVDNDGLSDAASCIRIEDILNKLKTNKLKK